MQWSCGADACTTSPESPESPALRSFVDEEAQQRSNTSVPVVLHDGIRGALEDEPRQARVAVVQVETMPARGGLEPGGAAQGRCQLRQRLRSVHAISEIAGEG